MRKRRLGGHAARLFPGARRAAFNGRFRLPPAAELCLLGRNLGEEVVLELRFVVCGNGADLNIYKFAMGHTALVQHELNVRGVAFQICNSLEDAKAHVSKVLEDAGAGVTPTFRRSFSSTPQRGSDAHRKQELLAKTVDQIETMYF